MIFHYTSASAFKAISTHGQAWASKIQHLNDEREYVQYIDSIEKSTERLFNKKEMDESAFADFILETTGTMRNANIFVASFTEKGDLLSQWRGYCPNGGYSIGFSIDDIKVACQEQGLNFCKAVYGSPDPEELRIYLEKLFRNFRPAWLSDDQSTISQLQEELLSFVALEAPRYKHEGFEEEAEWRAYSPILDHNHINIDVVDIRGMLRPILKFQLLAKADQAANDPAPVQIRRVYISPGPDRELRRESAVILLNRNSIKYDRVEFSKVPYTPR